MARNLKNIKRVNRAVKALSFLFLLLIKVYAQEDEIHFTHLTTEDGLSLNGVTQILQDDKGFLWFGTFNGLNRYDGYNFKLFLPEPSNPKSVSSHSISSIYQDSKGIIWIGTIDGLNRFDAKTEEFYGYRNDPKNPNSISNNHVYSIYEDKSGVLWVGTLNGLNRYDREKDNFIVIKKVNEYLNPDSLNTVTCIREDYRGKLWLGTWNGLTCMEKDGRIIKQYFAEPLNSKTFDYRKVSALWEDELKNLWIGLNGHGLLKLNQLTGNITTYRADAVKTNTISNDYITVIYQDKQNILWVGTKNGLNRFDPVNEKFFRIIHDPQKSFSIISDEILTIKKDNTGLTWIGTAGGISRFYKSTGKFEYFDKSSPISDRTFAMSIDKNENLWVGSFDGLYKIDGKNKRITHFEHQPGNKNSFSDNFLMSVFADRSGTIWAGTNHSGLNRYDPSTGQFKLYSYDINNPYSLSNNGVTSICESRDGTFWFGTWWGLNHYDPKINRFDRYLSSPARPDGLRNDLIWAVLEDSRGTIWVGTDGGGAGGLDPKTGRFVNFMRDSSGIHHISENRVLTLFESKDGIIWFGTTDGLNSYNPNTGKISIFHRKDGLPGNLINGIEEDDRGCLWVSTDKGLSKYNRKKGTFSNYSKRSGLHELEFNQNIAAKSKTGILYFGCKSGLVYFNPDSIKDEYSTAPLVFTDLKIHNQSVPISYAANSILNESINGIKKINIPYKNDVITIEFALLDFFNIKDNQYLYKLEGFEEDWNYVGTRNTATYTNIPPGRYRFVVKAFNNETTRNNPKEASIFITIDPLFYQTVWFKVVLGAAALLAVFLVIQTRTRKIKERNKILENRVAERTKDLDKIISELSQEIIERKNAEEKVQASLVEKEILLKEVHHRVKNNLQIISSLLHLQSFSIHDAATLNMFEESQSRIRSMALIHEKLYQSKNLGEVNLNEYVESLVEQLAHSYKKTGLTIKTRVKINNINLSLDASISCGLIINELMTNAYKYAFPEEFVEKKGNDFDATIDITVENRAGSEFVLILADNGAGPGNDIDIQNSDSLGLKIVYSLVHQMKGRVEISSENGLRFKITFQDQR